MILTAYICSSWGGQHSSMDPITILYFCSAISPLLLLPACMPTHESTMHDTFVFAHRLLWDPTPPQPTFFPTVGVFVERFRCPEAMVRRPGGPTQSLGFYSRSATDCNTLLSGRLVNRPL